MLYNIKHLINYYLKDKNKTIFHYKNTLILYQRIFINRIYLILIIFVYINDVYILITKQ